MKKAEELHPLELPEGSWQKISIDIIEPLPKSNRQDIIVVIVNQFTKMIRLKAIITTISLKNIAKIYRDKNYIKYHKRFSATKNPNSHQNL